VSEGHLRDWFEDLDKQAHAARLGFWLFLASEVLLFSALFALYAAYRLGTPGIFAKAARHTDLVCGTAMTFTLLTSSLTVALSLHAAREGRPRAGSGWLAASVGLGVVFLGIKAYEYHEHWSEGLRLGPAYHSEALPQRAANAFFTLYYLMTGLHALHVLGGMVALGACAVALRRGRLDAGYVTPLELSAMYWHLVDSIWLFLWPIFYLMR
jgi:cytochrome c oxidase subunit III